MYREARKSVGLSIEEASFRLHVAPRTLCKYEAGDTSPSPEVILGMAREYTQPELTLHYCRQNCAIGKAYGYEVLDAVDTSPVAVLTKLMIELGEARAMLDRVMSLIVNKQTKKCFADDEWMEFKAAVLEFFDVEHNVEVLKLTLGRMCDVSELVEAHNQKCRDNGYVKEKTAPNSRAVT